MSEPAAAPEGGPERAAEPAPRRLVRAARRHVREAKALLARHHARLSSEARTRVEGALASLAESVARPDGAVDLTAAMRHVEQVVDDELGFAKKTATREILEAIALAALVALVVRGLVLEPFKIPTPSMVPTLLVGDRLFVNKLSYGLRLPFTTTWLWRWSTPARGDVIVFVYPRDPNKDYIKRVIAVGGDRVRVAGRDVFVNGAPLVRGEPTVTTWEDDAEAGEEVIIEGLRRVVSFPERAAVGGSPTYRVYYGAEPADRAPFPHGVPVPGLDCDPPGTASAECVVRAGHVFVMGDYRDNSADSRTWGAVPLELLRGRAVLVWWSSAEKAGTRWSRALRWIE